MAARIKARADALRESMNVPPELRKEIVEHALDCRPVEISVERDTFVAYGDELEVTLQCGGLTNRFQVALRFVELPLLERFLDILWAPFIADYGKEFLEVALNPDGLAISNSDIDDIVFINTSSSLTVRLLVCKQLLDALEIILAEVRRLRG